MQGGMGNWMLYGQARVIEYTSPVMLVGNASSSVQSRQGIGIWYSIQGRAYIYSHNGVLFIRNKPPRQIHLQENNT